MKRILLAGLTAMLAACASEPIYTPPENAAVDDFLSGIELETVDSIRRYDRDSWQYINDRYIVWMSRPGNHLLEFRHNCDLLRDSSKIHVDLVHSHRNIYAGVFTVRGCIVERIYPINDDQLVALRNLGDAPG